MNRKALPSLLYVLIIIICLGQNTFAQRQAKIFNAQTVSSQDKAGAVHVAIIGARPMEDVVDELQPKFEMTEKLALESSIPTSLSYYNEVISAFKASLKVALPFSSTTSTETTKVADGKTTRTLEEVDKKEPGDLSKVPKEEAAHPSVRDGKVPETSLGYDPLMRYQAAKTLFQEIKLLNRSLKDIPKLKGFSPYIVTVQVSLMPYQRDLPYDAYSTMAFFSALSRTSDGTGIDPQFIGMNLNIKAGERDMLVAEVVRLEKEVRRHKEVYEDGTNLVGKINQSIKEKKYAAARNDLEKLRQLLAKQDSTQTPVIVPLLATDNLEAADNDRILNQIRQFNLALAAMFSGVGASLGTDFYKQNLQAVNGRDLNGLLTLGRLTENTLRVRLGAMYQSRSEFAMIPRTHNIALIVLIPENANFLEMQSRTTFRDSRNGEELARRTEAKASEQFRSVFAKYDAKAKVCSPSRQAAFLKPILENRYDNFLVELKDLRSQALMDRAKIIWLELAELYVGSQYGSARVELPRTLMDLPPAEQAVIYFDDESTLTATVRGGKNLKPGRLKATLTVKRDGKDVTLLSDVIEASGDGSLLRAKFPSLTTLGVKFPEQVTNPGDFIVLKLEGGERAVQLKEFGQIKKKPEPEDPQVVIAKVSGYLASGDPDARKLSVSFKTKKDYQANSYSLDIRGPLVIGEEGKGAEFTSVLQAQPDGTYKIKGPGTVIFTFGSLSVNREVELSILNERSAVVATTRVQVAPSDRPTESKGK